MAIAVVVALGLCAPTALQAQSRNRVSLQGIRTIGVIGRGATYTFQNFSYGLGSLQGGTGGTGGGVLSSSIGGSSFSLQSSISSGRGGGLGVSGFGRSSGSAGSLAGGGVSLGKPSGWTERRYSAMGDIAVISGSGLLGSGFSTLGAAETYLGMVSGAVVLSKNQVSQEVTSLVPEDTGLYRKHFHAADQAFRGGDYIKALSEFELAGYIAPRAPEYLLSMAQASFAQSRLSYASASHYLRQALKYFPELPTIRLVPRGFFGSPAEYMKHVERLEKFLDGHPYDVDANLMQAYFRWFSSDVKGAQVALSKVLAVAAARQDKNVLESVDTFWTGMMATGKVSGELKPAELPQEALPPRGAAAGADTRPSQ